MLALSFLIEPSSKLLLLVTRTGVKARTSSISGLWFPWPIYMFFQMRFDHGTLGAIVALWATCFKKPTVKFLKIGTSETNAVMIVKVEL